METPEENIVCDNDSAVDETEEIEKTLSSVINKRKTVPSKCIELHKKVVALKLLRLENAKVILDEDTNSDDLKKMIQKLQNSNLLQDSLDNLSEAENKLQKYHKCNLDINAYLKKRKNKINV